MGAASANDTALVGVSPDRMLERIEIENERARIAATTGTVRFDVKPWGEIRINGNPQGVSPPMKRLPLPEGKYDVTITNPGFAPYVQKLEVIAGKSVSIQHEFK
jgi:hypothetical protein